MVTVEWHSEEPAARQFRAWSAQAREPGILHVLFDGAGGGSNLEWGELEQWTRSRAVTVAEVRSTIWSAALDVALCSDVVYLHRGVELVLPQEQLSPGLLWALGRAGRAALARGLLNLCPIAEDEAVRLGLAQKVLEVGESSVISDAVSLTALTTARDLLRSSADARPALELAGFRLLFAAGDPREGASAFFDRRVPDFKG